MNDEEKELVLRELYYSPKTGYRSSYHLYELVKEEYPTLDISKYFIKKWLLQQSSFTRFKKLNNPKHYRHTMVRDFDQLQMDLVILEKYSKENKGYQDILSVIEILSRFAFSVPLKTKNASDVKVGIEKVLEEFKKDFLDIQNLYNLMKEVSF